MPTALIQHAFQPVSSLMSGKNVFSISEDALACKCPRSSIGHWKRKESAG